MVITFYNCNSPDKPANNGDKLMNFQVFKQFFHLKRSNMKRIKIFSSIALALTFLALVPKMEGQIRPPKIPPPPPRPLCAAQFALVNYACAMLPFTPGPPPSPPSPSSPDDDRGHSNHHHGHGHRHNHRHHQLPQEADCCRWLKGIDTQCACEILVRLPIFLVGPLHQYSVAIGESCYVTYSCGGLL